MSAASYTTLAQEIAARVSAVTNTGLVHIYLRKIDSDDKLNELCKDNANNRLACWFITRTGYGEELKSVPHDRRESVFMLHGFLSHDDSRASELIFQEIVNDLGDVFSPRDHLGDLVLIAEPLQAKTIGHAMLHNNLCHYAELELRLIEFFSQG